MSDLNFVQTAYAISEEVEAISEVSGEAHSEGLSINPAVVGFQALNFIVLLFVLHKILYAPILGLLKDREKRIRDGVENAIKADEMIKESSQIRLDMIKTAKVEGQDILEKARKSAEGVRENLIKDAQAEADKLVTASRNMIEADKEKSEKELKALAVNMVVSATEKLLRKKLDSTADAVFIEESLTKYSA